MPDYTNQWAQENTRKIPRKKTKAKSKPSDKASEIADAEFMIIGFIALVADLLGPFGIPCILILWLWSAMRFQQFPTKKIIGASLFEILSLGFLPGWSGFVLVIFLEQKGYIPKWISKLTKGKMSK